MLAHFKDLNLRVRRENKNRKVCKWNRSLRDEIAFHEMYSYPLTYIDFYRKIITFNFLSF